MLNRTLHVGAPDGPPVLVLSDEDGNIAVYSSITLNGDEELYHPDGWLVMTLTGERPATFASLFESRSIQQVLEEDGPAGPYDFGWRFVHQGWWVTFESGRVLYGDLVAKNQNRSGVGVQGPTSIELDFGSPLTLIQKIDITNGPVQVNGWKSSSSPTSYILKPSDVAEDDDSYVYADASIRWDGETGEVALLNLADGALVEFEASSTVTVEV